MQPNQANARWDSPHQHCASPYPPDSSWLTNRGASDADSLSLYLSVRLRGRALAVPPRRYVVRAAPGLPCISTFNLPSASATAASVAGGVFSSRFISASWRTSELIDDQQRDFLIALLERGELPLVACLNQALHQIGCTGEVNPASAAARGLLDFPGQSQGAIFPVLIGPAKITVLSASDEVAARQFHQLLLRHALKHRPVELVEAVLISGKRASRSRRRWCFDGDCDLGFEQFAQQILAGQPASRARRHSPG